MGAVNKLERSSKEMSEAIAVFERDCKSKGLPITREGDAPKGYWYTDEHTNTAFYWFLSGKSYGECCQRD